MDAIEHTPQSSRKIYFDYLRVIACFAVIVLHTSSANWYDADVNTLAWQTFNFYDAAVRWSVPVFVMISGALFLDPAKELPVGRIFRKYLPRIVWAYLFWSLVYVLLYLATRIYIDGGYHGAVSDLVTMFITGHYHMWFLFMIAGLYIITPLVRRITSHKQSMEYFLVLFAVFALLLPQLLTLNTVFKDMPFPWLFNAMNTAYSTMSLHFPLGFTGYFIRGYYRSQNTPPRWAVWLCGVLGFSAVIGLSAVASLCLRGPTEFFYAPTSVPVCLESVFVFCSVKAAVSRRGPSRADGIICALSKYSFGIYLVHALVLEVLRIPGITGFPSPSLR